MPSVSRRRACVRVRFRVRGLRCRADRPALPGSPAAPRSPEIRERASTRCAHGGGHVRRGPGRRSRLGRPRAGRRARHPAASGAGRRLLLRARRSGGPQHGVRHVRPARGEPDRRLLALAGGMARPRRRAPRPRRRHLGPARHLGGASGGGEGTPPFEPIATWAPGSGRDHFWSWSPRWEAAAGQALAHLLAASEGRPVSVPDGWCEQVFQRALDALLPRTRPGALPADRAVRLAVLAGPGLPVPDAGADIVLVPVHPQTGETWTPTPPLTRCRCPSTYGGGWPSPAAPGPPRLGRPARRSPPRRPARTTPRSLFRADPGVFRHALARLPAARSPWLREISENLAQYVRAGLF